MQPEQEEEENREYAQATPQDYYMPATARRRSCSETLPHNIHERVATGAGREERRAGAERLFLQAALLQKGGCVLIDCYNRRLTMATRRCHCQWGKSSADHACLCETGARHHPNVSEMRTFLFVRLVWDLSPRVCLWIHRSQPIARL